VRQEVEGFGFSGHDHVLDKIHGERKMLKYKQIKDFRAQDNPRGPAGQALAE
jgi:hypothetical protein